MAAQERYKEDPEIAGLMRDIKLLFFGPEQVSERARERRGGARSERAGIARPLTHLLPPPSVSSSPLAHAPSRRWPSRRRRSGAPRATCLRA